MKAERAIVAAVCIACAYATLVGVLVGVRAAEIHIQNKRRGKH